MSSEQRYKAMVPDTLDLAERAALAVNALTGAVDTEHEGTHKTYVCGHLDQIPAYMNRRAGDNCHPKAIEALQKMRVMSGSKQNADFDLPMIEGSLADVEDDGLWWFKVKGKPWFEAYPDDHVCITPQVRLIDVLIDRHKIDGDTRWLEMAERLVHGLASLAIHNEDRAWYFYYYYRGAGWQEDTSPSVIVTGGERRLVSAKEPEYPDIYTNGQPLRIFSRWYALTGDKKMLDLAHRLARFVLKASAGENDPDWPSMIAGREHGLWYGHFHSWTMGLKGLVEYATVTNDTQAARYVAACYEWARYFGMARIGFFPGVIGELESHREKVLKGYGEFPGQACEACGVGDMVWLAVRMSEAGIGDYWEHVDQYARNHLVEHQWVDRELLEAMVAAGPKHETDPRMQTDRDVMARNVGAFASGTDPTWAYGWWTMCCNGNVPVGLYEAWDGIVRGMGDMVQVNLLINRASAWLDIDSSLPYEGKVVLKNKTARTVHVRMPQWVAKSGVRCRVGERQVVPGWVGSYLFIGMLAPGDSVTIEFPIVETTEKHAAVSYSQEYTCHFRGNTLVDISPRPDRPARTVDISDDGDRFAVNKGYPIYLRNHYKANKAPTVEKERYVAPNLI